METTRSYTTVKLYYTQFGTYRYIFIYLTNIICIKGKIIINIFLHLNYNYVTGIYSHLVKKYKYYKNSNKESRKTLAM